MMTFYKKLVLSMCVCKEEVRCIDIYDDVHNSSIVTPYKIFIANFIFRKHISKITFGKKIRNMLFESIIAPCLINDCIIKFN